MPPEKVASLRIERRALADGKAHPRNPRVHPAEGSPKWEALKASLRHDYFDPLVLNERNSMWVSGHFRQKVMLSDGYTHADLVIVDYDEETHYARMIAANNPLGDWDDGLLAALARDLDAAGIDIGLAGWDEKKLASLLEGPTVDDDTAGATVLVSQADEIQRVRQVKLGDLYAVGVHRVLCGDCTDAASWKLLLGDELADMVWTDPPYNVDYDDIQRRRIELKTAEGKHVHAAPEAILNDDLSPAAYEKLLRECFTTAYQFTKPGGSIYVAHADSHGLLNRQCIAGAGWYVAQCLIWVKNAFTLGRQDYQWQHEPILYGWRPGAGHYWQGGYSQASVIDDEETDLAKLSKPELLAIINRLRNARDTTVVREPRNVGNGLHPTVKPLPLVARQIWSSSKRGAVVLELFGGSGTTLLAAEQTGRRAVVTELDPRFCAVILERATRHGLKVEKLRDGLTV